MAEPHELAAADFMGHKGYPGILPEDVEYVGKWSWIFSYDLDEGILELLVSWDNDARTWSARLHELIPD